MRQQSYALLVIRLTNREVLSSNLSGPIFNMNEIEELKQFKEKFEREEKQKKFSSKIAYLFTALLFSIILFYSANIVKSSTEGLGDITLISQIIFIFNLLAVISAIIFIILLIYFIFSRKKEKSIQP